MCIAIAQRLISYRHHRQVAQRSRLTTFLTDDEAPVAGSMERGAKTKLISHFDGKAPVDALLAALRGKKGQRNHLVLTKVGPW